MTIDSVGDLIHQVAAAEPDAVALCCDDESWTFAGLAAAIDAFVRRLEVTARRGDRVAVLAENCPEFVVAYYAVPRAGMSLVHLNYRLSATEVAWQVRHSGATVVLAGDGHVETAVASGASVERLVGFGAAPGAGPRSSASQLTGPAWIIYTSGTTGRPKGVMLSSDNLLAGVATSAVGRPVASDDVYLFPFPLCHVSGYNVLLQHLHGRPVVLMRRFDSGAILETIARHGVTAMSLAPTMIAMLLADPAIESADLSSLRVIGYGASPITTDMLERAVAAFGCGFNQGYGMTELSGNATFLSPEDHERALAGAPHLLTAAGRPVGDVEIRIDVGGEILVSGPQVAIGYLDDPETTAATMGEGWMRTGDIGEIDDDGYLRVLDRLKDIIVSGGENVASREVEEVLAQHPAVTEVAVVGWPHATWGEQVVAFVVAPAAGDGLPVELGAHARRSLAGYKCPKVIQVVAELPKNSTGKVQKAELRSRFDVRS